MVIAHEIDVADIAIKSAIHTDASSRVQGDVDIIECQRSGRGVVTGRAANDAGTSDVRRILVSYSNTTHRQAIVNSSQVARVARATVDVGISLIHMAGVIGCAPATDKVRASREHKIAGSHSRYCPT